MRLPTKSRAGITILVYLANYYNKRLVQVLEISKNHNISVKYIEQLIRPLKKADLVVSVRGPKGGHMLARTPETITLGEIARAFEGVSGPLFCRCNSNPCMFQDVCRLRGVWEQASKSFYEKLDNTTITDLLDECCAKTL